MRRLLLLLVVLLAFPASAHAAFPGHNGKLAFDGVPLVGPQNAEIYTVDPGGGQSTRLTAEPGLDNQPAWSPDGNKIAFVSNRDGDVEIWVMKADGGGLTQLTHDTFDTQRKPAWSPSGTKIAFENGPDIWVMDADGSNQQDLTPGVASDTQPAWSPDGSKIAFHSDRDPADPSTCCINDIIVMNADGSGQTRVTNTTGADVQPDWSPDGSKLAFVSNRDGNGEIYVMNPDGTGQTRLTNSLTNESHPVWSPDGSKIAFADYDQCSDNGCKSNILVMNADGSGQMRVTNDSTNDDDPSWQPLPVSSPQPTYDHPLFATPIRVSLVPDYRQTISPTQCAARGGSGSTHGAPLALPSCNPPAFAPGTQAHFGPGSSSWAGYDVIYGDTNPANGNQADLTLRASLSDIRTSDGADYDPSAGGPDLTLVTKLRISDRLNGGSQTDPATVQDFDYQTPIDCASTPGPEGSTCALDTSADAITPNRIRENEGSVVQVFRFRVNDSGTNGTRGDADDRIFAVQGIYVP